ncbi:MAG: hypothetical protein ACRD0S_00790 [Acidimicrobiales bacterium]
MNPVALLFLCSFGLVVGLSTVIVLQRIERRWREPRWSSYTWLLSGATVALAVMILVPSTALSAPDWAVFLAGGVALAPVLPWAVRGLLQIGREM